MTPFFASWYLTRTMILSLKTTQKSCATCQKMELFWWPILLILSSGQNSTLCKSGIFFPRTPLGYKSKYIDAKCCSDLLIFIIMKSKSNWALFPLISFGDGRKTIGRRFPQPHPPVQIGFKLFVSLICLIFVFAITLFLSCSCMCGPLFVCLCIWFWPKKLYRVVFWRIV